MNPKNYNGLRGSGLQVPIGSQLGQEERTKMAIMQQMQALSLSIYERAAASWMDDVRILPDGIDAETYEALAKQCQFAARSYFVGIGLIQIEPPQTPDAAE